MLVDLPNRADYPIDWFDVLDAENRLLLTEREILNNLQAIVADADKTPVEQACACKIPMWSQLM